MKPYCVYKKAALYCPKTTDSQLERAFANGQLAKKGLYEMVSSCAIREIN